MFQQYLRKQIAELRPWIEGDDMSGIRVSAEDTRGGSPKLGDMIARNPKNHADQWLVAAAYFADNFEPTDTGQPIPGATTVEITERYDPTSRVTDYSATCLTPVEPKRVPQQVRLDSYRMPTEEIAIARLRDSYVEYMGRDRAREEKWVVHVDMITGEKINK